MNQQGIKAREPHPKTQYQIAWEKYSASGDFILLQQSLLQYGVKEPYATNIIRSAFDAGWNMPKIK